MVPASFDFCRANLNREAGSAGASIPSESLSPTARFLGSSIVVLPSLAGSTEKTWSYLFLK